LTTYSLTNNGPLKIVKWTNLLQQIVKRRKILSVNVCGVADEVVAVVARLADLFSVAAGVAGTSVLHAPVATTAFHLQKRI
jgi:hypothetical protein